MELSEWSVNYIIEICFVDDEKAFDRVNWKRQLHALRRMGIDWKDS